jgi:cell division protease FtsH
MKTPKTKTSGIKGLGFYIFPLLVVLILAFGMNKLNPPVEHTYTDALAQIEAGNAKTVVVNGQTLIVTLNTPIDDKGVTKELRVVFPYEWSKDLYAALQKAKADGKITGFNYTAPADYSMWMTIIPFLLMLGLMVFLWMTFMRQSNDGKNAMSFGRSKARLNDPAKNKITFRDVAGADEEKEELREVVDFLKNPKKYSELGARIPKGLLLVGPPGTGKTLLAKAVAGEAGVPFFSISGSDFVEMFVGVGASRVRDLFDNAKKNSPCIVFIDEIDAVGRHRGAGMGGGHDEREQTLNQLLVEMDGFGPNEGVIILAATNRPDILDPALMRPGRFDRRIMVSRPDIKGREAILQVHSRNKPIAKDVDMNEIARSTPGFTGADLENLLNEAALLAARRGGKEIIYGDITEAVFKVMIGPEKKSRIISENERRLTAYHEAGHAVVLRVSSSTDKVERVSIIPAGMAGGYTAHKPNEDQYYSTRSQLIEDIMISLGGRAAEEIVFNEISTGAASDLKTCNAVARDMITRYGMSEKLGNLVFGSGEDEVFLGRDYGHVQNYSEKLAGIIDDEIKHLIDDAYVRVKELLNTHRKTLDTLAEVLLKQEKVEKDQFEEIYMTNSPGAVAHPKRVVLAPPADEKSDIAVTTNEDGTSAVVAPEEKSASDNESDTGKV